MKSIFTTVVIALAVITVHAQTATSIGVIAGNQAGFSNGTGYGAAFNFLSDVARGPNGNYYVADRSNRRVRKVTPNGVVTTLAGSGAPGYTNGTGTAATFGLLEGITVDANGNVYVSDGTYKQIRKISPAGVVTTLATTFFDVAGICVDSSGNVFVADPAVHRIYKVLPNGSKSIFAGSTWGYADGQGGAAKFRSPTDIAIDANGDFYVTDAANYRIRKITSSGLVSTFSGNGTNAVVDGSATTSSFSGLHGITCSGNSIYVTEQAASSHRVRRVASDGSAYYVAGANNFGINNGPATTARFNNPSGITTDGSGHLVIADYSNHRLRSVTMAIPLPVTLIDFRVEKSGSSILLKWSTTLEENNSHYNIQKSTNGIDFETIGIINTKMTNSNTLLNYHFSDSGPVMGTNYYRLEQIDFDGSSSYSSIKKLFWHEKLDLKFYPNPVKEDLHLSWAPPGLEVSVLNIHGVPVLFSKQNVVSVASLPSGLYFIQVRQKGQEVIQRFVKQ